MNHQLSSCTPHEDHVGYGPDVIDEGIALRQEAVGEILHESRSPASLQAQLPGFGVAQEGVGEVLEDAVGEILVAVLDVESVVPVNAAGLEVEMLRPRLPELLQQPVPHPGPEEVYVVVAGNQDHAVAFVYELPQGGEHAGMSLENPLQFTQ